MLSFALIAPAYAQAAGPDAGGAAGLIQFLPLLLVMVVMYVLMIRPQQQRAKQQRQMIGALRRGDRIVTAGGLIGTVARVVSDDELLVDLADNVRVRVVRSTITNVLAKGEAVADTPDGDGADTKPQRRTAGGRKADG